MAKTDTLTEQVLKKAGGSRGKKGSRKAGRNKVKCAAYRSSGRREKNKLIKLKRHLAKHLSDKCAEYALAKLKQLGRGLVTEYSPV